MSKVTYTEEQKRVINHENGDILVSASAGSGKTHTMITRLIRLILEEKTKLKNVLALTFTEAAASDMKEKLRQAIIKQINQTDNKNLALELDEIQSSDISTIDSFCKRLIKKYFYVAGVSPDFGIADEILSKGLKAQAIDKTFRDFYAQKDPAFLSVVERYAFNRSDGTLREIVLSIFNACSSEADEDRLLNLSLENYSEHGFLALLDEYKFLQEKKLRKILKDVNLAEKIFSTYGLEKSAKFCDDLIGDIDMLLNSESIYGYVIEYKRPLAFDRKLTDEAIEAKAIASACRDKIKKIIESVKKHITTKQVDFSRCEMLKEHTKTIFDLVKTFTKYYSELKSEENLLDFADLERFACKILEDDLIRESIKEQYNYVFVDEYQDVNGVQEKIISLISKDNVFMVGDVKQSIYGFRGCRPEFFAQKFDKMEKSMGATQRLNSNFRSAPKVVDTVNQIFNYSMNKEYYGQSYKDTAQLVYGGLYNEQNPGRAELHLLLKENKERQKQVPVIYDILNEIKKPASKEISDTASLVAKIIKDECLKTYFDKQEVKPVLLKDIAVLTRSRNSNYVIDLIKGLKTRGIPVYSDTKEPISDYPEIKAMLSLLELTESFYKDVALATVMKSPIGAFSDEELALISITYQDYKKSQENISEISYFANAVLYYGENGDSPLKEKVEDFLKYISDIRKISDFVSAFDVLQKVIVEKNVKSYFLASRNGEEKIRRLEFLLASTIANGKRYSSKEFVKLVKGNAEVLKLANGGNDNAVKVMTIHASKGLEFPVVIVCGLEKKHNTSEERENVLFDRELGFATRFYNDEDRTCEETLVRGVIKERLKEQRLKEELRLFYVALTRATYSLNLTYVAAEDTRKSVFDGAERYLDYIPSNIPVTTYEPSDLLMINNEETIRKVLIAGEDEQSKQEFKKNLSFKYKYIADTLLPLKTTVTEANSDRNKEFYKIEELFKENSTTTDAEKGMIAHRFLELYDFANSNGIQASKEDFIARNLIAKEDFDKIDLEKIGKALNSEILLKIKDKKLYKEKSFLVSLPASKVLGINTKSEVLIQGIIDLLAIDGDCAYVIDYKYSSLGAEKLKERYKKQLDLYALAVEKVLGLKVVGKYIVSLVNGETIKID